MPQDWDRAFKQLIKEKAAEVLGLCGLGGPYTGRYEMDGHVHTYSVLDLKRRPPAGLLESSLAPLALLAGDPGSLVAPVVDRIAAETDPGVVRYLLDERFSNPPDADAAVSVLAALPVAEVAERIKRASSVADLIG